MPAQIAHILLGLEAAATLPSGWFEAFSSGAFRLGCQGPDIFYHNRRTKPGAFLYGTRLHRRGWGTFLALFRGEALDRGWGPDHPGMAFLAGHATHGALDRQAHPFIVYFSGWKVPGDPSTDILRHSHAFLERILDVALWEHRTGRPWAECDLQDDLPGPEAFPADFWEAWANALHGVFPQLSVRDEVEQRLKNAVSDTRGFLGFTSPQARHNGVRAAEADSLQWFHPEVLPDWDFANVGRAPWRDPVTGQERTESFFDLVDRAADEARTLLRCLTDRSVDWESLAGNGSLNLPGADGENLGPAHSRPWDYAELYRREASGRLRPPALP